MQTISYLDDSCLFFIYIYIRYYLEMIDVYLLYILIFNDMTTELTYYVNLFNLLNQSV